MELGLIRCRHARRVGQSARPKACCYQSATYTSHALPSTAPPCVPAALYTQALELCDKMEAPDTSEMLNLYNNRHVSGWYRGISCGLVVLLLMP